MTPPDALDLGPVGVTFLTHETVQELRDQLVKLSVDPELKGYAGHRIVLAIPRHLAHRLQWPEDPEPVPAVFSHDLVFMPPRATVR